LAIDFDLVALTGIFLAAFFFLASFKSALTKSSFRIECQPGTPFSFANWDRSFADWDLSEACVINVEFSNGILETNLSRPRLNFVLQYMHE
jgi:hypothetical protein